MSFCRTQKVVKRPKYCTKGAFSVPVVPSKSIYYEWYPYKVDIIGDRVNYDPVMHYELNCFIADNCKFRIRNKWSYTNRTIYFSEYADVEKVCTAFSDIILRVHGPISNKHFKIISENDYSTEIRTSLYYGKYDTRIEFSSRNNRDAHDTIFKFVEQNFNNYRWNMTRFIWYYNYLYCNKSELDQIIGFLKIALSDYMSKYSITTVVLLPQPSDIDK